MLGQRAREMLATHAVDGIPDHMPKHRHGQGYADLNFLIPEPACGVSIKVMLISIELGLA